MTDAPKVPKIHTAVVSIPNHTDAESIAKAAAHAALQLLAKVSSDARGSTTIDRVSIVQPTTINGSPDDLFQSLLTATSSKYAVMVSCVVLEKKEEKSDA